jgi:hypothetical protein
MILFDIISRLLTDWTGVSDYIEIFVASEFTFLNEEQHDSLLFDDDTFSRSRQYSWVITSIGEFIPIIDNTMKHYSDVESWVIASRSPDEDQNRDEVKSRKYREQLYAIRERFNNQKGRAEALRDGVSLCWNREFGLLLTVFKLFNASAVVESRLSTRLAQNVKLLTYVSIFYLPLAFCAVGLLVNTKVSWDC